MLFRYHINMSYSIVIHDAKGKVVETKQLNENIFADENINDGLIHEFYVLQQANARLPYAHTKTRAEVAGSGRKLYKQKGTGNARVGEARSPIRRHGWVAFGPRNTTIFSKDMPKKMKKLALAGVLTIKAKNDQIVGLVDNALGAIKTKEAIVMLQNIGLANKKTLIVLPEKDANLERSMRNVPAVKTILASYLNPVDLLHYEKVLVLDGSLEKINTLFA